MSNESGYCGCGNPTNKTYCDECSGIDEINDIIDSLEISTCAEKDCNFVVDEVGGFCFDHNEWNKFLNS